MNSDPVIDEVRSARRKISASYGHDARKMIADHMIQQQRYADRLVMPGQARRKSSRRAAKKHTALAV
jgi:hypothetical protein